MSDQPNTPILGPGDGDTDEPRTVPVSHPNYDAQREEALRVQTEAAGAYAQKPMSASERMEAELSRRIASERQEVGVKMLKVLEEMRDSSDASFGALVVNTGTIAAGIADIHETLEGIKASLQPIGDSIQGDVQTIARGIADLPTKDDIGLIWVAIRGPQALGDGEGETLIGKIAENTRSTADELATLAGSVEFIRQQLPDLHKVFEVGMENDSTVGNHSILANIRAQLRIIMEAVEGHPGIVVGQDFRETSAETLAKVINAGPGVSWRETAYADEAQEDTRPRAMLVTLTPGNVRAILANFKASENRSNYTVTAASHPSMEGARLAIGQAIVKLPDGRQEVWGLERDARDAYPDAVWLERELPEPAKPHPGFGPEGVGDYRKLAEVNGWASEPVRQTGAARPAAEATLPDEKLTAKPEQIVVLEKRQREAPYYLCADEHDPAPFTPMPHGWVCPICHRKRGYHEMDLPNVPRLVQEEAADARQAHDEAREPKVQQGRASVPLAPMPPLPEYDMTAQVAAAFDAYEAVADLTFHMPSIKESGVKSAIIKAINAFNEKQTNIAAEQIMAQMAALDGPSYSRLSTSFKDGMWGGLNNALKIVRGEVE